MSPGAVAILKADWIELQINPPTVEIPTMNATIDTTTTSRLALTRALDRLDCKVHDKAAIDFGFRAERTPKTAQELIDWIKADEFTAPDTEADDYDPEDYCYEPYRGIRFKPLKKKDREGFDKHLEEFRKARETLNLEIQVLDPEKALEKFKKLEKEYLH